MGQDWTRGIETTERHQTAELAAALRLQAQEEAAAGPHPYRVYSIAGSGRLKAASALQRVEKAMREGKKTIIVTTYIRR